MARNFFDNLPSTRTPVEAGRMNALLDGDEAMGNILVDTIRTKNMFNINGEVNIQGNNDTIVSSNSVSGNVLTTNINGSGSHGAGQKFTDLNGKTITFSAKCISTGTGTGANIIIYDNRVQKAYITISNGQTKYLTYTATSDNVVLAFSTVSGTGAQLTDIQVEYGSEKTDYAEFEGVGYIRGKNENGEYVKYDDGTLICHMTVDKSGYVTASASYTEVQGIKWYRSYLPDINFPISFIDRTYQVSVIPYMEGQAGSRLMIPKVASKTVSKIIVQFISVEDFTSSGTAYTNLTSVDVIAIGRWK